MRILATGGGTGGHVYPALVVLGACLAHPEFAVGPQDVAWVGSADSIEEKIVARESLRFYPVATGALRGANPLGALRSLANMVAGYRQARRLIREFQPDVVLATGGYVSVPLVLAARSVRCPSLVYLPDITPGLAVKFLSFFADRVAVSFDSVAASFPRRKVSVTGYPVRQALYDTTKASARERLGLHSELPVLMVLGGSRGARSINRAVLQSLGPLLRIAQVIHISGPNDYEELKAAAGALPLSLNEHYHLYTYLYEQMTDALVAADLVVARAGAATLGEFPAVGLPAILAPYPYAGQHQQINADYLAASGGALVVADDQLAPRLLPLATELFSDRARLQTMSAASRALAAPDAALRIAQELFALSQPGQRKLRAWKLGPLTNT